MACGNVAPNPNCQYCKDKSFTHRVIQIDNPENLVLFHKVVIPASLGDETTNPPYPGKYCNVLMVYEANGHAYLYSSDGIPTALGFDSGGILVVDEFPEIEQAAPNFLYIKKDDGQAQITTDNIDWTIIAGHYGAVYAVDTFPAPADAELDSLYVDYTTGEAKLTHDNVNWITISDDHHDVLLVENFPDVADAEPNVLYVSSTDKEARITGDNVDWVTISGGGGSGVTDFDQLTNRPKVDGAPMTSSTNIPISSLSSSLSQEVLDRQQADSTLEQNFNAITTAMQGDINTLNTQMTNKVDKVAGKGLSTNDFTNAYKNLVDSAIQPSDLNYTVMTNLRLPTNPSTTSLVLTEDLINIGTGTTSDRQIALPVASTTQAGIINKATYDTIQDNAEKIDMILNGAVAIAGLPATPTQAALTTAWKTETGKTTVINGASILDTTNSLQWTYYTNDNTWHSQPIGSTASVSQFTNTSLGTIMGSNVDGQVFAEPNGTGSVKGWDALVARVTNAETSLTNKVDKVTGKGLSTNDFTDALKTKLDGIEAGAEVNDPLYSTTGSNTNGAMTQAATTNALALKLSHGNLTTSGGLEKTVTGSGTNTAIDVKIADLGVTTAKIANGAVTGVANDATVIGSAKLALNTVGTPNLRNKSVTTQKINWDTIRTAVPFIYNSNLTTGTVNVTSDKGNTYTLETGNGGTALKVIAGGENIQRFTQIVSWDTSTNIQNGEAIIGISNIIANAPGTRWKVIAARKKGTKVQLESFLPFDTTTSGYARFGISDLSMWSSNGGIVKMDWARSEGTNIWRGFIDFVYNGDEVYGIAEVEVTANQSGAIPSFYMPSAAGKVSKVTQQTFIYE